MKRLVDEGGFSFAVRRRVPTGTEFTREMDERRAMREGNEAAHDLVEVDALPAG
ncbi:hypothetical protein [Olsenella profusa]|uniref:Uncharacterized protein n=1 Tax=Olsenella profusa TaxID=138595 RepID=A0ABS2F3I7_9ACTN|nr:hypothetical protein [Olsenella profusa]MBM6775118.1 hypothetical protein [Olsenella profusa]